MVGTETILVTGGAGFIGSHTCVELLAQGYRVVALDNLVNSHEEAIARIRRIADGDLTFVRGDACSREVLGQLFDAHAIAGVIHFAAHKAVGDSVRTPLEYYRNNIGSLLALLDVMQARQVKTLVFSSSATVYGDPASVPLDETAPLSATSPYAQTKLTGERILADLAVSDPTWRIATLRYFNPVGAHESGLIGEDPSGIPNNLMPFVARVASGRLPLLRVFGRDWPTPDGTGVRDYVHVVDLAQGHIAALAQLKRNQGSFTVNLGTGRGYSVLEVIAAFERASGRPVPYEFTERRSGDVAVYYAATNLARTLLGWQARYDLDRMCEDAWRWQSRNPSGYLSE